MARGTPGLIVAAEVTGDRGSGRRAHGRTVYPLSTRQGVGADLPGSVGLRLIRPSQLSHPLVALRQSLVSALAQIG